MPNSPTTPQCSDTNEQYWFQNEPVTSVQAAPIQNIPTAMRCNHCQHWFLDPEHSYRAIPGIKECRKAVQLWNATEWVEDEPDENGDLGVTRLPKDSKQMSFVQDGSDYRASLWTKPEFFCAHFEAVETNNEQ